MRNYCENNAPSPRVLKIYLRDASTNTLGERVSSLSAPGQFRCSERTSEPRSPCALVDGLSNIYLILAIFIINSNWCYFEYS